MADDAFLGHFHDAPLHGLQEFVCWLDLVVSVAEDLVAYVNQIARDRSVPDDAGVFVFPSFTDTFGLVILEAAATGTPVAAYIAPGPKDILPGTGAGVVDKDLRKACLEALKLSRDDARALAERYSWRACAKEFRRNLEPLPKEGKRRFWHKLRDLRARAKERRQLKREAKQAAKAEQS
jgi:glycosyltransferase involved in cell wall biosynthesis